VIVGANHNKTSHAVDPSGSDRFQAEPDFLVIGQIIKPHGVRGEVFVKVLTDFTERFEAMETVRVGDDTVTDQYAVEATRWHKNGVLLTFNGITDRSAAEKLRGLYLKIPASEAMPLGPDTYYHYQLVGLAVITDAGEALGHIAEILETGANDVYVVQGARGEILLPATKEVVLSVNLQAKQMIVHLLDGLL